MSKAGSLLRASLSTILLAGTVASAATPTTTTLTVTSSAGAVTSVSSGTVVTLTATVNPTTVGQVSFCDATATYCTDVHLMGTAQIAGDGTATLRFVPGLGNHSYKAVFMGTVSSSASASADSALQVTGKSPSTTNLSVVGANGNYTFTGTVLGVAPLASPVITGTLTIQDNTADNAVLATVPVSGTNGGNLSIVTPPGPLTGFSISPLTAVGDFTNDCFQDLVFLQGNDVIVVPGGGNGVLSQYPIDNLQTASLGDVTSLTPVDFGTGGLSLVIGSPSKILVLYGGGTGHFSTQPAITSTNATYGVVAGDANHDGRPDLIVPNFSNQTVDILLNNGDRTFANPTSISASNPISVVLGDFTGDSNTDIVVLEPSSSSPSSTNSFNVQIFTGDGTGAFQPLANLSIQGACCDATTMIPGDFDRDGKLDMAVPTTAYNAGVSLGAQVLVYSNLGDGMMQLVGNSTLFNHPDPINYAYGISVADFNGDGIADITWQADPNDSFIEIGDGHGSFSTSTPLPGTPSFSVGRIGVADFNGDGYADVPIVNINNSPVVVAVITPSNSFTTTQSNFSVPGTDTHQLQAVYSGDDNYSSSLSDPVSVAASSGSASTLSLSANPTTSVYGHQVALTATLSPRSAGGHSTDGELITFAANSTVLGTAPLSNGVAVLNTTSIPPGFSTLQAGYAGDVYLAASTSPGIFFTTTGFANLTFNVANHTYGSGPFMVSATSDSSGAITYSVVSGPATIVGSTVTVSGIGTLTLLASQAATDNYPATTKSTSFVVMPAPLTITANSTARVFGTANPTFTGTVLGMVNGDTFTESFTTLATAASIVGGYAVIPSVTGANLANYVVTPTNGTLTITQAGTATTLALSNQNTVFTAKVASISTGIPTGTVTFLVGQTAIGSGTLDINGNASYTASAAPTGNVVISAQYGGDVNFTQSAAPPILLLTAAPDTTGLSVAQSGAATDKITFSSISGYTGTVQLSCANLPPNTTCTFQPTSLTFGAGSQTASTNVTITTGTTAQAFLAAPTLGGNSGVLAAFGAPGLFVLCLIRRRGAGRSIPNNVIFSLLLLVCTATLMTACGSGSSTTSNSTTPTSPTTKTGTYTINVNATGSSGLTQSVPLTLTVHQ
ncbi:Ig-like domain repeat protein [Edaphobacter sp. HDX4]